MLKKVNKFSIKNVDEWITFFSRTGSEIVDIISYTGRVPDKIVTNIDPSKSDTINKFLIENYYDRLIFLPSKPTVEEYETILGDNKGKLVTLHGWLRVVPKDICKKYKMYNGHPGLPQLGLIGKDPQVQAYLGNFTHSGSIIHEVIPEVDKGKVLVEKKVNIEGLDLEGVFLKLKETSKDTWLEFFDNITWKDD